MVVGGFGSKFYRSQLNRQHRAGSRRMGFHRRKVLEFIGTACLSLFFRAFFFPFGDSIIARKQEFVFQFTMLPCRNRKKLFKPQKRRFSLFFLYFHYKMGRFIVMCVFRQFRTKRAFL